MGNYNYYSGICNIENFQKALDMSFVNTEAAEVFSKISLTQESPGLHYIRPPE